jgi:hypothetical protein
MKSLRKTEMGGAGRTAESYSLEEVIFYLILFLMHARKE